MWIILGQTHGQNAEEIVEFVYKDVRQGPVYSPVSKPCSGTGLSAHDAAHVEENHWVE